MGLFIIFPFQVKMPWGGRYPGFSWMEEAADHRHLPRVG